MIQALYCKEDHLIVVMMDTRVGAYVDKQHPRWKDSICHCLGAKKGNKEGHLCVEKESGRV